jgi:hypothetical protein
LNGAGIAEKYSIGYDDGHTECHESGRAAGYEQRLNENATYIE